MVVSNWKWVGPEESMPRCMPVTDTRKERKSEWVGEMLLLKSSLDGKDKQQQA